MSVKQSYTLGLKQMENHNAWGKKTTTLNQPDQNCAGFMQAKLQDDARCTSKTSFPNSIQHKPV